MKRALAFSGLMVFLVMGATLVVWWIGPSLVSLAVVDSHRDQPYLLLNLSRSDSDAAHEHRYTAPLSALITSEGGVALGSYRLLHLMQGEQADQWDRLDQYHMAQAQDTAQVMTASPFRLLGSVLENFASLQLGQYEARPPRWGKVIAVWLVRDLEGQKADPLAVIRATLDLGEGKVVWQTDVDVLGPGEGFDRAMVVAFDSEQAAWDWLRLSDVVAARSIANARTRYLSLAVYLRTESSGDYVGPS